MILESPELANPGLVAALLTGDAQRITAALGPAILLIPSEGGTPGQPVLATRPGPGARRRVPAFTDAEALAAWDRAPAEQAVAVAAGELARTLRGDVVLMLNPAGPGAHLLGASPPPGRASSPGPAPRAGAEQPVADLSDPGARRPARRRAREAHRQARQAADAGDLAGACRHAEAAIAACDTLGDRLHAAAAQLELARWRARSGAPETGLGAWREAALTMAELGELDLAAGALLDAAELARDEGLSGEAEALAAGALELVAGATFSDRLTALWRSL